MRILMMKGQSQYGGTRLFADLAAAALARRGHQVDVLDLGETDQAGLAVLQHAVGATPYGLIFTINIAGEFRDSAGRTLGDLYGAPHVVWHTDYILSKAERVRQTPKSTALLLVDPSQVDAVRAVYGEDRFERVGFFPHPAVGEPAPDEASVAQFCERRPIRVLWSGGFQKPETPWKDVDGPARQLLADALDLALSVEWTPPHEALAEVMRARGLDPAAPELSQALEAAALLDVEVRMTRRFEFLKAVAKSGVALHIVGAGWEGQLYRFKTATFEGPVDMTRMVELMRSSRVVLNTNGNFGAGSHERPFSAALAGAATFSDYSRYYGQVFDEGEDIALFRWRDLAGGMDQLKALAADPARAFEMARRAKAKTLAQHTWDQRIGLVLEAGEAVRGERAAA
jgi:hypothetical protein